MYNKSAQKRTVSVTQFFFPVDTTLGLCAAESFGGGHVKTRVSFRYKTGEFQISTKQFLCDYIIKEDSFLNVYPRCDFLSVLQFVPRPDKT